MARKIQAKKAYTSITTLKKNVGRQKDCRKYSQKLSK